MRRDDVVEVVDEQVILDEGLSECFIHVLRTGSTMTRMAIVRREQTSNEASTMDGHGNEPGRNDSK